MATEKTSSTFLKAWKILWYGFIAGMISGWVKIGWEALFPPRTPARDAINPPQHMAQQIGIPDDLIFSTVQFNGNDIMWFTLILHFVFAVGFSILFVLLIQKWKKISMCQGMVYGFALWVIWHVVLMPLLGTTPGPLDWPWEEWFSEIIGHLIWGWSIAVTSYFLIAQDPSKSLKNFPIAFFPKKDAK